MRIVRGRDRSAPSERRSATFTGTVWADPVLPATDGVTINNVFFAPCSRTHWHHHEAGQVLVVLAGEGLIRTRGLPPERIAAGDTVWVPPGETHWHGAAPGSYLIHTAVSLGRTVWLDPVTDAEYAPDATGTPDAPKAGLT